MKYQAKLPESWKIGIDFIDNEHQEIYDIINNCWHQRHTEGLLDCECFEKFIKMLKEHFINEENHMKKTGYPKLEAHAIHHQQMLAKILEKKNTQPSDKDFLALCNSILFEDMVNSDLDYNAYLQENNLIAPYTHSKWNNEI